MGFDEHLTAGGVSAVEWSEKIDSILQALAAEGAITLVEVTMEHTTDGRRTIHIQHQPAGVR